MITLAPNLQITSVQNTSELGCREIADLQRLYDSSIGQYYKDPQDDLRFIDLFFIKRHRLQMEHLGNGKQAVKKIETGRICKCLDENGAIIGFILAFDTFQFGQYGHILRGHYSDGFKYRWKLVSDLEKLEEDFVFISVLVVDPAYRNQGIGKNLLESIEYYYLNPKSKKSVPIMIATVINENQRQAMQVLNSLDYLFVDYHQVEISNLLWFRALKVLDLNSFTKAMNHQLLPQIFKITIPIQLAMATQKVNHLIGRINNAKVLWSSFFQYDYPILSNVFNMDRHYNSHYSAIFANTANDQEYSKVVAILKKVIKYLNDKDRTKLQFEYEASLTRSLKKEGFEFFLINDEANDHIIEEQFPNSIKLNLNELTVEQLARIPALEIGDPLNDKESNDWGEVIFKRIKITSPQTEEDFNIINRWKEWVDSRCFTPKEADLLLKYAKTRFHKKYPQNPLYEKANLSTFEQIEVQKLLKRKKISPEERSVWEDWVQLHRDFYEADQQVISPSGIWCHAIIPFNVNKQSVMGAMFSFTFERRANQDTDPKLLGELAFIISSAFAKHMLLITEKLMGKVNSENLLKYAISTVMNRNLSHNFGSHVLSKLSSPQILNKYIHVENFEDGLKQIAAFNSFLQSRMDFLADISTSEPVSAFSRQLKADLIERFNSEEIVRRLISGSDLEKVIVKFERTGVLKEQNDLTVQIPNGELGCHSFFIILENIIRNSAKHESARIKGRLEITIKAETSSELNKSINQKERGYYLTIYDNIVRENDTPKSLPSLVEKLNEVINKRLIEDWHRIRPYGWGMAEMKIAAAYLRRKLPSQSLDSLSSVHNIPLLKAVAVPVTNQPDKYFLGFRIYLKKPREILIIDSAENLKNNHHLQSWMNEGIKLVTVKTLENYPYIHSHNIALLFDATSRHKIETFKIYPLRWLVIQSKSERDEIFQCFYQNINQGIDLVWSKWIFNFTQKKGLNSDYILLLSPEQLIDFKNNEHKKIALFDLHGDILQHFPFLEPQLFFYEAYSANSSIGKILGHIKGETELNQKRIKYELIEAALTQVVILDERVQQILYGNGEALNGVNLFQTLKNANVFIPEVNELSLFKKTFETKDLEILRYWLDQIFITQNIDFIVLHIGLVEKMIGKTKAGEIDQFVDKFIRTRHPTVEVVFITGRGKPHKLPEKSLYVTYSTLAKYVVEEPSKYHLTRVLYSAREILDQYEA